MFTIFDLYYILGQKIHSLHYILRQARGVLAMDGGTSSDPYCKVVVLSFNSWLCSSFSLVSHHCFPLPLETHNAILQGDPGKRKAQEQDNQQHVKSQMEGGDGPKLVKFYQHKRSKAPPCNYQV